MKNSIFLLSVSLFLSSGCANWYSAKELDFANKLCENNGGLSSISSNILAVLDYAYCRDGAVYTWKGPDGEVLYREGK